MTVRHGTRRTTLNGRGLDSIARLRELGFVASMAPTKDPATLGGEMPVIMDFVLDIELYSVSAKQRKGYHYTRVEIDLARARLTGVRLSSSDTGSRPFIAAIIACDRYSM